MSIPTISKQRLESFSDAVFAIVVTLIVIEFHVPHLRHAANSAELWHQLYAMAPLISAWLISFGVVCIIWLHHSRIIHSITRVTTPVFWHNAALLLLVALIPFPAQLIGTYPHNAAALTIFGGVLAATSLCFSSLRFYIQRHNVLKADIDTADFAKETRLSLWMSFMPYAIGMLFAWINPIISFFVYFAAVVWRIVIFRA